MNFVRKVRHFAGMALKFLKFLTSVPKIILLFGFCVRATREVCEFLAEAGLKPGIFPYTSLVSGKLGDGKGRSEVVPGRYTLCINVP